MYIVFHGGTDQSEILHCGWTDMAAYRQIIHQVY